MQEADERKDLKLDVFHNFMKIILILFLFVCSWFSSSILHPVILKLLQ